MEDWSEDRWTQLDKDDGIRESWRGLGTLPTDIRVYRCPSVVNYFSQWLSEGK
jgi:hypothetical protein